MKVLNYIVRVLVLGLDEVLNNLYKVILNRIERMPEGSYTVQLVRKGLSYVVKKFGEESVEVIIAALSESRERFVSEVADLLYHLLVLMALKNVSPNDVAEELIRRRR